MFNKSRVVIAALLAASLNVVVPHMTAIAQSPPDAKPANIIRNDGVAPVDQTPVDENSGTPPSESPAGGNDQTVQEQGTDPAVLAGQAHFEHNLAIAHYDLASLYFQKFQYDLSEVEFEEAISHWADMKIAHRDLCLVEILRGQLWHAFAECMVVVGLGEPIPLNNSEKEQLNIKARKAHYHQGLQFAYKGNWNDAMTEFQQALSYAPNDAGLHRSIAFAYANLGKFDEAEKHYAVSFQIDPSDAFAHADYATLLSSEKGQEHRAVQQLFEATKLAPDAAALHVDLGWMAEATGDFNTAGTEFRKAANLSPKHAELWTHLGRVLERQGKPTEAIAAYSKALDVDPQHDEAKERMAKLKATTHS